MKYYVVSFSISAPSEMLQDVRDVVAALAGEAGFETFEDTEEGMKGYVQREIFDASVLQELLTALPFPEATVSFKADEADDCDWNQQWEQQGFDPISVGQHLIIYDGRHTPHPAPDQMLVEIDAQMAFGTGNHQTTRMMAEALTGLELTGRTLLDCGTGTGILAIVALLRGAGAATGYDIDEWSVNNARHNAILNGVDQQFKVLLGDSTVISRLQKSSFDVVTANINRNILLADMHRFLEAMKPGATLLLSGFYTYDSPLILEKATGMGLQLTAQQEKDDWACLQFMLK